jgi:asparagine synthase (glutamine-hydrolysing)
MNEFMQDMLRSKVFASIPFYSQSRVLHLLEQLPEMDLLDRAAMDPVLMMILTTCILHQRFNL